MSAHGSLRIVTERSRVAMPETAIGFVPDVGGTHLLAAAPGELGTHLALTGRSVGAADALLCGLADHYVPTRRLPELTEALAVSVTAEEVERTVRRFAEEPPAGEPGELAAQRDWIDACYSTDSVEEIVRRLEDTATPQRRTWSRNSREGRPWRSRSRWQPYAGPPGSAAWKPPSTRSSVSPPGSVRSRTSSRASAPGSSTRTAVRSGSRPSSPRWTTARSPASSPPRTG